MGPETLGRDRGIGAGCRGGLSDRRAAWMDRGPPGESGFPCEPKERVGGTASLSVRRGTAVAAACGGNEAGTAAPAETGETALRGEPRGFGMSGTGSGGGTAGKCRGWRGQRGSTWAAHHMFLGERARVARPDRGVGLEGHPQAHRPENGNLLPGTSGGLSPNGRQTPIDGPAGTPHRPENAGAGGSQWPRENACRRSNRSAHRGSRSPKHTPAGGTAWRWNPWGQGFCETRLGMVLCGSHPALAIGSGYLFRAPAPPRRQSAPRVRFRHTGRWMGAIDPRFRGALPTCPFWQGHRAGGAVHGAHSGPRMREDPRHETGAGGIPPPSSGYRIALHPRAPGGGPEPGPPPNIRGALRPKRCLSPPESWWQGLGGPRHKPPPPRSERLQAYERSGQPGCKPEPRSPGPASTGHPTETSREGTRP